MLQLAVKRGLADAKYAGGSHFVASSFLQGAEDGTALHRVQGDQLVVIQRPCVRAVMEIRRQIIQLQCGSGPERDCALDGILKFAHVAWPIVGHQTSQGFLRQFARRAIRISKLFEECIGEERDIALSFAQRRNLDLHDVQTEIEILPKCPVANRGFKIAVCRRDDARPQRHARCGPDRLDLMLLQRAKQFGLQVHGHVADFVEK